MGLNRYFVPNLPTAGSIELPPDEAHHAFRVRRETEGARCVAFDGHGHIAMCRIIQATKRGVVIEVESHRFEPNEPPGRIRIAVAMPKGDRQKAVIEKAVELGVHELVPLIALRSVSLPNDSASDKWHRAVIEACKQCERNRLMSISQPCSIESLMQAELLDDSSVVGSSLKTIAHPWENTSDENALPMSLFDRIDQKYSHVTIAIGPEGGFTNAEVRMAIKAGWRQLDFGPRIFRVETAVCVASFYACLCVGNESRDARAFTE